VIVRGSATVGVTFRLALDALQGWPSWLIAAASLTVLLKLKIDPAWAVLGGVADWSSARFVNWNVC
jgi:hypothetical protein